MATEILAKVLTSNDDSGRHGVLIPEAAYSFFPQLEIPDPEENATSYFELTDEAEGAMRKVAWKYYQRYPERRVTRLNAGINDGGANRLVVFTRTTSLGQPVRYSFGFANNRADFERLARKYFEPNGVAPVCGAFVRISEGDQFQEDKALKRLLSRFDTFRGEWQPAMRTGPTGVGYTFETLMGVAENNDKTADFLGIELKAKVRKEAGTLGKTNLFQQAPEWSQSLTQAELIRKIGQLRPDGSWACYSAVTVETNNLGLYLLPKDPDSRVNLRKVDEPIGFWPYATLERRLLEKHNRAVFVDAKSRSTKGQISFRYGELVYCERPKIENFVSLVKSGDILFEFTMSEKEHGKIRNHGYPWRMKDQSVLSQLFALQLRLRDSVQTD